MQKISKKSKDKLYEVVHDDIMLARIKIYQMDIPHSIKEEIDKIMSDLGISAPLKAICCFKYDK